MKYNWLLYLFLFLGIYTIVMQKQINPHKPLIDNHVDQFNKLPDHDDSVKILSSKETSMINAHGCSHNCLECKTGICRRCSFGLYSYLHACYETCPFDTLADNIEMRCKLKSQNPICSKAYTVSRCINSCGKVFPDCSCNPLCEKSGDCCSDYKICDFIQENSGNTKCSVKNCIYCTKDGNSCLQCKPDYFYFYNYCLKSCPNNTITNVENRVCFKKTCDIENCERCNGSVCEKCLNGKFLQNGSCVDKCDKGMIANRKNFTCVYLSEKPFYWIYPSRGSCFNSCGKQNFENDCSCEERCLNKGNCCQDFEYFCGKFFNQYFSQSNNNFDKRVSNHNDNRPLNGSKDPKSSKLDENHRDKIGFKRNDNSNKNLNNMKKMINSKSQHDSKENYNSQNNTKIEDNLDKLTRKLEKKILNKMFKGKNKEKPISNRIKKSINQLEENSHITDNNNKIPQPKSLNDHLKDNYNLMSQVNEPNNMIYQYLNGNITVNSLTNNSDTQISENNEMIVNSFNINDSVNENLNSYNNIKNIISSGDINNFNNQGLLSISNNYGETTSHILVGRKNKLVLNKHNKIDHLITYDNEYANNKPFEYVPLPTNPNSSITNQINGTPANIKNITINNSQNSNLSISNVINMTSIKSNDSGLIPDEGLYPQKVNITKKADNYDSSQEQFNNNDTEYNPQPLLIFPSVNLSIPLINPFNYTNFSLNNSINSSMNSSFDLNKTHSVNFSKIITPRDVATRALIIGNDNQIKDNQLVNNIISVHNSYIFASNILQNGKINPNLNFSSIGINPSFANMLNDKYINNTINSYNLVNPGNLPNNSLNISLNSSNSILDKPNFYIANITRSSINDQEKNLPIKDGIKSSASNLIDLNQNNFYLNISHKGNNLINKSIDSNFKITNLNNINISNNNSNFFNKTVQSPQSIIKFHNVDLTDQTNSTNVHHNSNISQLILSPNSFNNFSANLNNNKTNENNEKKINHTPKHNKTNSNFNKSETEAKIIRKDTINGEKNKTNLNKDYKFDKNDALFEKSSFNISNSKNNLINNQESNKNHINKETKFNHSELNKSIPTDTLTKNINNYTNNNQGKEIITLDQSNNFKMNQSIIGNNKSNANYTENKNNQSQDNEGNNKEHLNQSNKSYPIYNSSSKVNIGDYDSKSIENHGIQSTKVNHSTRPKINISNIDKSSLADFTGNNHSSKSNDNQANKPITNYHSNKPIINKLIIDTNPSSGEKIISKSNKFHGNNSLTAKLSNKNKMDQSHDLEVGSTLSGIPKNNHIKSEINQNHGGNTEALNDSNKNKLNNSDSLNYSSSTPGFKEQNNSKSNKNLVNNSITNDFPNKSKMNQSLHAKVNFPVNENNENITNQGNQIILVNHSNKTNMNKSHHLKENSSTIEIPENNNSKSNENQEKSTIIVLHSNKNDMNQTIHLNESSSPIEIPKNNDGKSNENHGKNIISLNHSNKNTKNHSIIYTNPSKANFTDNNKESIKNQVNETFIVNNSYKSNINKSNSLKDGSSFSGYQEDHNKIESNKNHKNTTEVVIKYNKNKLNQSNSINDNSSKAKLPENYDNKTNKNEGNNPITLNNSNKNYNNNSDKPILSINKPQIQTKNYILNKQTNKNYDSNLNQTNFTSKNQFLANNNFNTKNNTNNINDFNNQPTNILNSNTKNFPTTNIPSPKISKIDEYSNLNVNETPQNKYKNHVSNENEIDKKDFNNNSSLNIHNPNLNKLTSKISDIKKNISKDDFGNLNNNSFNNSNTFDHNNNQSKLKHQIKETNKNKEKSSNIVPNSNSNSIEQNYNQIKPTHHIKEKNKYQENSSNMVLNSNSNISSHNNNQSKTEDHIKGTYNNNDNSSNKVMNSHYNTYEQINNQSKSKHHLKEANHNQGNSPNILPNSNSSTNEQNNNQLKSKLLIEETKNNQENSSIKLSNLYPYTSDKNNSQSKTEHQIKETNNNQGNASNFVPNLNSYTSDQIINQSKSKHHIKEINQNKENSSNIVPNSKSDPSAQNNNQSKSKHHIKETNNFQENSSNKSHSKTSNQNNNQSNTENQIKKTNNNENNENNSSNKSNSNISIHNNIQSKSENHVKETNNIQEIISKKSHSNTSNQNNNQSNTENQIKKTNNIQENSSNKSYSNTSNQNNNQSNTENQIKKTNNNDNNSSIKLHSNTSDQNNNQSKTEHHSKVTNNLQEKSSNKVMNLNSNTSDKINNQSNTEHHSKVTNNLQEKSSNKVMNLNSNTSDKINNQSNTEHHTKGTNNLQEKSSNNLHSNTSNQNNNHSKTEHHSKGTNNLQENSSNNLPKSHSNKLNSTIDDISNLSKFNQNNSYKNISSNDKMNSELNNNNPYNNSSSIIKKHQIDSKNENIEIKSNSGYKKDHNNISNLNYIDGKSEPSANKTTKIENNNINIHLNINKNMTLQSYINNSSNSSPLNFNNKESTVVPPNKINKNNSIQTKHNPNTDPTDLKTPQSNFDDNDNQRNEIKDNKRNKTISEKQINISITLKENKHSQSNNNIIIGKKMLKNETCLKKLCDKCKDNKCKKCKKNSIKLTDYNCECQEGFYYSNEKDQCEECHQLCASCFNANNTNCNTCSHNAKLNGNSTCLEQKGISVISKPKCDPEAFNLCKKCNINQCVKCKKHSLFDYTDKQCICKKGYVNMNNSCVKRGCSGKLKLCDKCESEEKCKLCKLNSTLFEGKCYCNEGYNYNGNRDKCAEIPKKCDIVPKLCEKCLNKKCLKCKIHAVKSGQDCICSNGYSYNSGMDLCEKIIPPQLKCKLNSPKLCLACNNTNNECIECKDNSEKRNTQDGCQCKNKYIYNKEKDHCEEKPCDKKFILCEKCRFNKCQVCKENSQKVEGKCKCVPGYEYDKLTDSCKKIIVINHNCNKKLQLCRECKDNTCIKCKSKSFKKLNNTFCICKKGHNYNPIIDECITDKCSEKINLCAKCKNERCKKCVENSSYNIKNNSCKCIEGFNQFNNTCLKNNFSNGSLCVQFNSKGECIKCAGNSHIKSDKTNCQCNDNYIISPKTGNCVSQVRKTDIPTNKNCSKLCDKCKKGRCQECKHYAELSSNNTCECIKGFTYNKTLNKCSEKKCDKKMMLCEKCENKQCVKCKKHAEFLENKGEGCRCMKDYIYNALKGNCKCIYNLKIVNVKENERCAKEFLSTNPLCIKCNSEKCVQCQDNAHQNNTTNLCQCDNWYSYEPFKGYCKKKRCTKTLCERCKKGKCKICKEHSSLNKTINECFCNKGYQYNQKNDTCVSKKCMKKVKLCKKCENNICQKCKKNSILNITNNECYCQDGFFYDHKRDSCISQDCQKKLKLCMNCQKNKCLKCKENSILNKTINECFCKEGFYYDEIKDLCRPEKCDKKPTLCSKCLRNQCQKCKENSYFNQTTKECTCNLDFYYNPDKDMCVSEKCINKLDLCIDCKRNECRLCKEKSSLNETSKECNCNKGFYYDVTNDTCISEICVKKLDLCNQCKMNKCLICKENSVVNEIGECECVSGFYYDKKSDSCKSEMCDKKLKLCDICQRNKCKECRENTKLNKTSNDCICNDNYYFNEDLNTCLPKACNKKIKLCKLCKKNKCKLCKKNSSYDKENNVCICNQGYLYNEKEDKCLKDKCFVSKLTLCSKCKDGLCKKCKNKSLYNAKNNTCYCQEGYFHNITGDFCQKIIEPEQRCKKNNPLCIECRNEKCFDCKDNGLLNRSECHCKPDYYYNITADNCVKDKCKGSTLCSKCEKNVCTSCKPNSKHKSDLECKCNKHFKYIKTNDTCLGNNIFYTETCLNPMKLCSKCLDDKCKKCKENSHYLPTENHCECIKGYEYDYKNDSCYRADLCKNATLNMCSRCEEGKCAKCRPNSIYNNFTQSCECKPGFTYNFINDYCAKNGTICEINKPLCLNCRGDLCIECKINAHFGPGNKCECNTGFTYYKFYDRCDELIQNCKPLTSCKQCSNTTKCLACKQNSFLSSSKCECKIGFYYDEKMDKCVRKTPTSMICDKNVKLCETCINKTKCIDCKDNSHLNIKTGKCECNTGFVFDKKMNKCVIDICRIEPPKLCKNCKNGKCLKCKNYAKYNNGTCRCNESFIFNKTKDECDVPKEEKCNPQTFNVKNNPMCIRCSQDECVQCQVHSSLQEISNPFNKSEVLKTCRCDKNYKYDKKANICVKKKCLEKRKLCHKCSEKDGKCIKCKPNSRLISSQKHCKCYPSFTYNSTSDHCDSPCSVGEYFNKTLSKCNKCNKLCKNCFGEGPNQCIKCVDNAQLNNNTCKCPEEFEYSKNQTKCKRIKPIPQPKNITCNNESFWDADKGNCTSTLLLKKETSNYMCLRDNLQFVYNKPICKGFSLCSSCFYTSKLKGCLSCKTYSLLNSTTNKCECIKGYFYSPNSDSCVKCHPLCNTCFGPDNTDCLSCIKNTTFIQDLNTCKCSENQEFNKTSCTCYTLNMSLIKKEENTSDSDNFIPQFETNKLVTSLTNTQTDYYITKKVNYTLSLNKNIKVEENPNEDKGFIKTKSVSYKGNKNKKMNENDESYTEAKDMTEVYFEHLPKYIRLIDKFCEKGLTLNKTTGECEGDKRQDNDVPVFVATYYLHGVRTPWSLKKNKLDILGQKWKHPNVLSKVGMREDYLMGHYLQNEFMFRTNFLKKIYDPKQVRFETASTSPCIQSSYAVLKGLYSEVTPEKNYTKFRDIDETYINKKFNIDNFLTSKTKYVTNQVSNKTINNKKVNPIKSRLEIRFISPLTEIVKLERRILGKYFGGNEPYRKLRSDLDDLDVKRLFITEEYIKNTGMKSRTLPYGTNIYPVHSFGNWSSELGVGDLEVCKGAESYIEKNFQKYQKKFEIFLQKLRKFGDIHKMFRLPPNTEIDFMTIYNITDAIFANKHLANANMTKYFNISDDLYKLLREDFMHDLAHKIFYGDKDLYLAKVVVSPSFKSLLKQFQSSIDNEKKKYKGIKKGFKNKENKTKKFKAKFKRLYKKELKSSFKFYMYFPKEDIFWGFIVFFSKILNKTGKLPLHSSFIQYELVKNETGFNMKKFLAEEEMYRDPLHPNYKELSSEEEKKRKKIAAKYIGNVNRYRVNIKLNGNLEIVVPFSVFKQKVETSLLSMEEIENFCFPTRLDLGLIVCLILFTLIIFQLLLIACIYTLRNS